MKKIIFLILSLVVVGAGAQEQQSYAPFVLGLDIGRQVFPISVTGSFFPPGLIPYPNYPPLNVEPGPATAIDVSHLPAGTLIRVKRLGAAQFLPSWLDETIYTMAVFANANGDHIPAGEKTNAWTFGPVHYCPTIPGTGVVDFPYDMNISGNGVVNDLSFILEIPVGAAKLLVATADCPSQDNTDPNGDYKLEVSFPIVEKLDYYQVIKNPILQLPSTIVDLVAGKNADVVIKTKPNMNIEGSFVEWKSQSGTTTKTFQLKPGQTTSTSSGDVTFYIDPVPKEADYINKVTYPIVHLRGKNASGITVDIDESDSQLAPAIVRKTKPIKIGYIPISGCNDVIYCFAPATVADATAMAQYGGEIMKAMYPVADDEFESSMVGQPQSIFRKIKIGETPREIITSDLETLERNRLRKSGEFFNLWTQYTVGVVDLNYFTSKNVDDWAGASTIFRKDDLLDYQSAAIITKELYFGLPHEFGHLLGGLPDPKPNLKYEGYSNYSLSSSWDITRGQLSEKETLMGTFNPLDKYIGLMNHRWVGSDEYVAIFKNNVIWNAKRKDYSLLMRLTGNIENGNITSVSAFSHFGRSGGLTANGDFVVKVTDIKGNVLSSGDFSPINLSEIGGEIFRLSINKPINAMFANFYKKQNGAEVFLKKIAIPAEFIRDAVEHTDRNLIIGDVNVFDKKIDILLKKLSDNLIAGKTKDGLKNLTDEIIPFLNNNIGSSKSVRTSSFLSDLNEIQRTHFESLAILVGSASNPQSPKNPFVEISLQNSGQLGQKSILAINQGTQPSSPNLIYAYKAFFDGIENKVSANGKSYISESVTLTQGWHQWLVKTYLVDKKLYNSFQAGINQYELDVFKLKKEYVAETDPVKKQAIQTKAYNIEELIIKMRSEQFNLMKELGNHVFVNLEVL